MTELELHQPQNALADQMKYAQAVSTANLLPQAYRGKPADIMLAMGLGAGMGLSPAESLYRIDVIQGKPCASAELIAANVRKAGHRLRVQGDEKSCTATIIRADDPDFPFTVTRDLAWAQQMGLTGKDNYKKQPGTMLQWRAISAVARLACPEALYGVAYTADEMFDVPGVTNQGGLGAVLNNSGPAEAPTGDTVLAHGAVEPDAAPSPQQEAGSESPLLTNRTSFGKAFYARMQERRFASDQERIEYVSETIGRFVESTKEITEAEARTVLSRLDEEDAVDAEVVG